MKTHGCKRTMIARLGVALGVLFGVVGFLAGWGDHTWKLGSKGWIEAGILLTLIGVFALLDGLFSYQRHREDKP